MKIAEFKEEILKLDDKTLGRVSFSAHLGSAFSKVKLKKWASNELEISQEFFDKLLKSFNNELKRSVVIEDDSVQEEEFFAENTEDEEPMPEAKKTEDDNVVYGKFKMVEGKEKYQPIKIEPNVYSLKATRFISEDFEKMPSGFPVKNDMHAMVGTGLAADAFKRIKTTTKALDEDIYEHGLCLGPLFAHDGELFVIVERKRGVGEKRILKGQIFGEMRVG